MIFSENRCPLFGIMPLALRAPGALGHADLMGLRWLGVTGVMDRMALAASDVLAGVGAVPRRMLHRRLHRLADLVRGRSRLGRDLGLVRRRHAILTGVRGGVRIQG